MRKKRSILFFTCMLMFVVSFSQNTLFQIKLNSGIYQLHGAGIGTVSKINYDQEDQNGYTKLPWGDKAGLCYGISADITRIFGPNLRMGLDLGYDVLQSGIEIDGINGIADSTVKAKGNSHLNWNFINLYPHLGGQFKLNEIIIALDFGCDLAYGIRLVDKAEVKTGAGEIYQINRTRYLKSELRYRIEFGMSYRRYGSYIGLSHSNQNYFSYLTGAGGRDIYRNVFRFGLVYQLNHEE